MQQQHPPFEVVTILVAIVSMFGTPLLIALTYYFVQAFRIARETGLKREMVARGYSAQEIVQVVAATRGTQPKPITDLPPAKPVKPSYFEGVPVQQPLSS